MNILITGGTGFVGQALCAYFAKQGDDVFILTRQRIQTNKKDNIYYIQWLKEGSSPLDQLPPIDAAVNLAGTSINSGRWTDKKKEDIMQSRLKATATLIELISLMPIKPRVLINASAVGFYGTSETAAFTESASYENGDFLADVVYRWEDEAMKAEHFGIRTVCTRFGLVLGREDGALPRMILPYKMFAGGTVGSGSQWVSWVHIEDLIRLIAFVIASEHVNSPVNVTAPHPVTMKTFGKTIGRVMKRPHFLPVPSFVLNLALGEMSTLVLKGQKVIPEKALENGFVFKYPELEEALMDLLKKDK
ncbi:hypothetical protein EV207_12446 [Scopulibacillus darangshiensis]|uniref:TIGR01777 family protein n=1 Tax=Scopulibacillus darangshiensis TaxID=442528 RepID=A0A4R2NRU7_9BACL|nr:TIGR01777 family oxidoreductase [Scopulibacillus darangshiensis]TCP24547.1 hypothetical protein EV207_12446 [Scopulibacillus darangshiensis]